jgi:hypothetical protein
VSDQFPNEPQEHTTPAQNRTTFVLSREQFDQIPNYRARYILLYIALLVWWLGPKIIFVIQQTQPPTSFAPIYYAVMIALYLPFYFYLGKTMKIMGYPIYWIAPTLLVVSVPIPGLLAMGYMDRKIADLWDKADDAHQKYRQHVMQDDEEAKD